ncbi:MAG TPA: lipopolysaccharide heptosyltransferase I [Thermoanaerobaculia bacterium]|nr:lipopolysaccharide heptosyltransferase I [Thermoanaerobaculia bacterium]
MKRLLVLRLSALGDVIHTIPAVVALRHANPDERIAWVVEAPYRELVELVAGVEAIPVRMKKWGKSLLASRGEMRDALRAMRGADTSIDFQGLVKSAMLGALAGAKTRIGFDARAIREKPALLFTNRKVHVDTTKHVIDQNLQLANVQYARSNWETFPTPVDVDMRDAIVFLPGAGKANKLWPVTRFRELAQRLGDRVLVTWGPGERDLAEQIGARLAPPTNLRELAWILRHARLVIGGDTGPLHLADALGTKVIGLYGPTDPRRNGPYAQLGHCLSQFEGTKCMESITVEHVMNMVQRVAAE